MNNQDYQTFLYVNINLVYNSILLFLGLYKKDPGNCYECQNNKCVVKNTPIPFGASYIIGLTHKRFICGDFLI